MKEQPNNHPSDFNRSEIPKPLLNATNSVQPSGVVTTPAKEENVTPLVQDTVTVSPVASPRTNLGKASNNGSTVAVSGEGSESIVRSPRDSRRISEDIISSFTIQSTSKGNSTAEQIQVDMTSPIASPRTNLAAHRNLRLGASSVTENDDEEIDSVVLRSPKGGRSNLDDRNSSVTMQSSTTSSTNSSSILLDLNSSSDSEKDHQHEFDGNFYSSFPPSNFSSDKNEEQFSSAVIDTTSKGSWPGMADITCEDIEDLGSLDPELGLLSEEPKSWINVVDRKLLEELSEKEIKRQEHIYEFIMSEKNHCIALIVIQNVIFKKKIILSKIIF